MAVDCSNTFCGGACAGACSISCAMTLAGFLATVGPIAVAGTAGGSVTGIASGN